MRVHRDGIFVTLALLVVTIKTANGALTWPDGTGKLPALGWNSWNHYGCDINHDNIMAAANAIVNLGLRDIGYHYINIDDCWSDYNGRDSNGHLVADSGKFPTGMQSLADEIHALNLKIGIYSSAGDTTCAGYPASLGHEVIDAQTFASWGIDYLKYDNCNYPSNWNDQYTYCVPDDMSDDNHFFIPNGTCPDNNNAPPAGYDWSTSNTAQRFRAMHDAILSTGRTILYSLCEWGQADVGAWGASMANSWRMSGDIHPWWERIFEILNENSFLMNNVDYWGHADADGLEIGNGLSLQESRTHFAFWAVMKSPLIISTDVSALSTDLLDILKNQILLQFNQDPYWGKPAQPFRWGFNPDWTFDPRHPAEYWMGRYDNAYLLLMLNTGDNTDTRSVSWEELGWGPSSCSYLVLEVWSGQSLGCVTQGLNCTLESHDTCAYSIIALCAPGDGCDGP